MDSYLLLGLILHVAVSEMNGLQANEDVGSNICNPWKEIKSSETRILIYSYITTDQSHIDLILNKYQSRRDIHGSLTYPAFIPKVLVANIIASIYNATLVSAYGKNICPADLAMHPTIYPAVYGASVLDFWSNQDNNLVPQRLISAVQIEHISYNFAYCAVPKMESEMLNCLQFFTWDVWTWLVVSIFGVSIFSGLSVVSSGSGIKLTQGSILLGALSVLLTPGLASGQNDRSKSSNLFAMWMFCSLILVTYYTGAFTSEVIKPPEHERMARMAHLVEQNFSAVFLHEAYFVSFRRLVSISTNLSTYPLLHKLLQSSSIQMNMTNYLEMLTSDLQYAVVSSWMVILTEYTRAVGYLSEKMITTKERRCYLGRELAFPEHLYVVFDIPWGNVKLDRYISILLEAGIYQLWHNSIYNRNRMGTGNTRVTVISPTQVEEDKDEPKALTFQGKLKSPFILWIVLLSCSGIIYLLEVAKALFRKRRTKQ